MYQQLEGGHGRAVYFRAPRIKASLLVKGPLPTVQLGEFVGRVVNLSSDGLLCDMPLGRIALQPGAILPAQLRVRGEVLFSSDAAVVRAEGSTSGTRIAVRFLGSVLEPDRLRLRAQGAVFRHEFEAGVGIYEGVPPEYRLAIGDAVLVLSHWRDLLGGREQEIRASKSNLASAELAELEKVALSRVRLDWQTAHVRATEAISRSGLSKEATRAAKRLTEKLLTPLLLDAPIWKQAYLKPRGYPGDFQLMNMMYDEGGHGDSTFARVIHQLGREERLAATVRNRKDFLVQELDRQLAVQTQQHDELRVASIGAGPAREVEEFLLRTRCRSRLVITLVDQDHGALEYAHERLRRAALQHGDLVDLRCRFVSFKHLLSNPRLSEEIHEQDLIYTAGLFDYLPDSLASDLLLGLAQLLHNGGRLLVGNAVDAPSVKWVPEFVLDWQMIYRSPDDMKRMARSIVDMCRLDIRFDESGAWQFLEATREC